MIIDEYLVKLGGAVDQSGMQRFHQALREASVASEVSAADIAGAFMKAQTEIVGGFSAIGAAALGLADKVAMADQSYRLFALHMYMGKDAARSLKVAMDALNAPLEDLTWDAELRARTHQLVMDQRAMAPSGDFDAQMRKIRDVRFEFTRMEVELQYLSMHVVQDFMQALGLGPDELLTKLRKFNDWVIHDLPQISQRVVTMFMPIWHSVEMVGNATWKAFHAASVAFANLVGLLTGDASIEGTAFDIAKLAGAVDHIVLGFARFATAIGNVEEMIAHLVSALALLFSGNFAGAGTELSAAFHSLGAEAVKGVVGGVVGGVGGGIVGPVVGGALGSVFGPAGTAIGAGIGGVVGPGLGTLIGSFLGVNTTSATEHYGPGGAPQASAGTAQVHALIDQYARQSGVDPALAHAVARHESGETQYDKHGNLVKNPGSSATGVFQLVKGTAKFLGVDSSDTEQNVKGGVMLLHQMLQRYHGNVAEAIGAYGEGAGVMDSVLAGKATLRPEAKDNIAGVMRMMGKHGDVQIGSITIHIDKKNATNEDVARTVVSAIRQDNNKRVQRNLAEFQGSAYGY